MVSLEIVGSISQVIIGIRVWSCPNNEIQNTLSNRIRNIVHHRKKLATTDHYDGDQLNWQLDMLMGALLICCQMLTALVGLTAALTIR